MPINTAFFILLHVEFCYDRGTNATELVFFEVFVAIRYIMFLKNIFVIICNLSSFICFNEIFIKRDKYFSQICIAFRHIFSIFALGKAMLLYLFKVDNNIILKTCEKAKCNTKSDL